MKSFMLRFLLIFPFLTASMASQAASVPVAAVGTEAIKIVVSSTADVIATFLGATAVYSDDLYLSSDGGKSFGERIFNNHASTLGSSVNLGKFAVGTELMLKMIVNSGQFSFFSGDAERNRERTAHARVQANWDSNKTLVGFEDMFAGGDRDYDDLVLSLSNVNAEITQVPLPAGLWLMGSALLGLLGLVRRKA